MLALAGCRQDMHNQPKYVPLRGSDFFKDGRSARLPVDHTVPRESRITDTQFYKGGNAWEDEYFLTGKVNGQPGDKFPLPLTKAVMQRGHDRFMIYCTPCHSRVGDGNGMVVSRGLKHPPSYHEERLKKEPIGYFFDVMTHGFGSMKDYSAQVKPEDRWAIAAYIRALQLSQDAKLSDVPDSERANIKPAQSWSAGTVTTMPAGHKPNQPMDVNPTGKGGK
jgi:mono/diheme cytochrome c family protein